MDRARRLILYWGAATFAWGVVGLVMSIANAKPIHLLSALRDWGFGVIEMASFTAWVVALPVICVGGVLGAWSLVQEHRPAAAAIFATISTGGGVLSLVYSNAEHGRGTGEDGLLSWATANDLVQCVLATAVLWGLKFVARSSRLDSLTFRSRANRTTVA